MHKIDARGLSCPEPVLLTKRGLEEHIEGLEITVDSKVSVENVSRYAKEALYKAETKETPEGYVITISK